MMISLVAPIAHIDAIKGIIVLHIIGDITVKETGPEKAWRPLAVSSAGY